MPNPPEVRVYPITVWHAEIETILATDGEWERYSIRHTHAGTPEEAEQLLLAGEGVVITGARKRPQITSFTERIR